MSTNSHSDDELFEPSENEELADQASTNGDDELFEPSDDVEERTEKPEKSTADEVREKSISAMQAKIDAGTMTIDDLPPNQKWMSSHLRPANVVDIEKIADEAIERKFKEREEERLFQERKNALNALDLNPKKKEVVLREYEEFRSLGIPKSVALEKAMKIAGLSQRQSLGAGPLPYLGSYAQPVDEAMPKNPEDRVKRLEALRKSQA